MLVSKLPLAPSLTPGSTGHVLLRSAHGPTGWSQGCLAWVGHKAKLLPFAESAPSPPQWTTTRSPNKLGLILRTVTDVCLPCARLDPVVPAQPSLLDKLTAHGRSVQRPFLSGVFPEDSTALSQVGQLVLLIFHPLNYSSPFWLPYRLLYGSLRSLPKEHGFN